MANHAITCRIDDCNKTRAHHSTLCQTHRQRIRKWGDPHFTQWQTADMQDVELIISERRPNAGLTRLERVLVARGLAEREVPAHEVARIVGVNQRTVERWRSKGWQLAGNQATPLAALRGEAA